MCRSYFVIRFTFNYVFSIFAFTALHTDLQQNVSSHIATLHLWWVRTSRGHHFSQQTLQNQSTTLESISVQNHSLNMETTCSLPSCSQPATLRCGACKISHYCSKECQKSHWKTHKAICFALPKYNCFLIHATPSTTDPVLESVSGQIEPLHLEKYGSEFAEIQELKARLGWKGAVEVGKFYDHKGTDSWYYYVYGESGLSKKDQATKPKNELANLLCYAPVFGDIAVIRSGPGGDDIPETFTKEELTEAVEFHKTNKRADIFQQREYSRIMRRSGVGNGNGMPPHVYVNATAGGGWNFTSGGGL